MEQEVMGWALGALLFLLTVSVLPNLLLGM